MAVVVGGLVTFFVMVFGADRVPPRPPVVAPAASPLVAIIDAAPLVVDTAAPPPTPSEVIVEITGVPAGVEVKQGARSIGFTPKVPVAYSTSRVVLTLVAPGHVPAQLELVPDKDRSVPAKLEKKKRATTPRPRDKDEIFRADQLPEEPTP
jgi:hypothetical protein